MPISSAFTSALTAMFVSLVVAAAGVFEARADTAERTPIPRAKPQAEAGPPVQPQNLVTIVPRRDWNARQPLFAMKPHEPLSILVHHTAGPVNPKRDIRYKMRALQAYSQKQADLGGGRKRNPWADVPYHFYISADGAVAEGREIAYSGDTNTNYDPTGHIQVVLEGNFENVEPTGGQLTALEDLLVQLAGKWKVPADRISTHKQVAATLCPGKNLLEQIPQIRERVAGRLE